MTISLLFYFLLAGGRTLLFHKIISIKGGPIMVMKPNCFVFFLVLALGAAWASSAEAGYTFTVTEDYTNEDGTPWIRPVV